jgi:hypothetical protein
VPESNVLKFNIERGADTEVLERIAAVTGGQLCAADPASIGDCYVAISAEQ